MFELRVLRAGTVPYGTAFEWQKTLHTRRVLGDIPDTLLVLEHPHVYTLGRRFSKEHLHQTEEELAARGIAIFETDRGGSITYHGPGQLVAYPIVDLNRPGKDLPDAIRYLRLLEEAIIRTVRKLGVVAVRREGLTGVWVGRQKLAAIGVNVSRGVSKHGLAINVGTDLSFFDAITPCGIEGAGVTSLQRLLNLTLNVEDVAAILESQIGKVFHRRPVHGTLEEFGLAAAEADVIRFPIEPPSRPPREASSQAPS